jgi:hypothetical protein
MSGLSMVFEKVLPQSELNQWRRTRGQGSSFASFCLGCIIWINFAKRCEERFPSFFGGWCAICERFCMCVEKWEHLGDEVVMGIELGDRALGLYKEIPHLPACINLFGCRSCRHG